MEAQGTFVAMNNVVSQSVPHFHVHVVPRNRKDGLRGFFWPRRKYESERHMKEAAEAVRAAVERLRS
jgi:histidine triad (HIT) family protein